MKCHVNIIIEGLQRRRSGFVDHEKFNKSWLAPSKSSKLRSEIYVALMPLPFPLSSTNRLTSGMTLQYIDCMTSNKSFYLECNTHANWHTEDDFGVLPSCLTKKSARGQLKLRAVLLHSESVSNLFWEQHIDLMVRCTGCKPFMIGERQVRKSST